MFMDAVQYSAVSRNLSEGHGSFWSLQFDLYNIHDLTSFSEQPPLAFVIQAIFFKILGTSIYTERIYTFVCLILTIILINKSWQLISGRENKYHEFGWLPVLLWITIPIVFWSFRNNMLENTMGVFVLLSGFYIFKGLKGTKIYLSLFIGAIFIFLATLTKGLPGLFTISIPILFSLIYNNIKFLKSVLLSTYLTILITAFYLILFLIVPESRQFYERYFVDRTLGRIGTESNNEGPLFIIIALLQQLLFPIAFTTILILFSSKTKGGKRRTINKNGILLMPIGLAGTFQMMLTPVQKQFYLTPALPFFALGFTFFIIPKISLFVDDLFNQKVRRIALRTVSSILIMTTIILCIINFGSVSRDDLYIADAKKIADQVEYGSTIGSTTTVYYNWVMHSYLIRNHSIFLDHKKDHEFYLLDKRYDSIPNSKYYTTNSDLHFFELMKVTN